MTPVTIVILVVLVAYAIFQQTRRHEVVGSSRFKLAIIYGIVGLVVGGFSRPEGFGEWAILTLSLLLSVGVGIARGRRTNVWRDEAGGIYSQGTTLTISLFLGLVIVKFAMGTAAYFLDISDDGGFGEILLMIAVMIAFQAELIWRRAQLLHDHRQPGQTL